jgi:MYXO-CTERM domain-containing protein
MNRIARFFCSVRRGPLRAVPVLSLVAALLSWAGAAAASATFPSALVAAVPMGDCTPGCAVCHRDNNGGQGTAIKPFAGAMLSSGLIPTKPESVTAAVEALRAKNGDLDKDGKFDIAELAAGQDPNASTAASICLPTYGYQCGVRIATAPARERSAAVVLLGIVVLGLLRRRRVRL